MNKGLKVSHISSHMKHEQRFKSITYQSEHMNKGLKVSHISQLTYET